MTPGRETDKSVEHARHTKKAASAGAEAAIGGRRGTAPALNAVQFASTGRGTGRRGCLKNLGVEDGDLDAGAQMPVHAIGDDRLNHEAHACRRRRDHEESEVAAGGVDRRRIGQADELAQILAGSRVEGDDVARVRSDLEEGQGADPQLVAVRRGLREAAEPDLDLVVRDRRRCDPRHAEDQGPQKSADCNRLRHDLLLSKEGSDHSGLGVPSARASEKVTIRLFSRRKRGVVIGSPCLGNRPKSQGPGPSPEGPSDDSAAMIGGLQHSITRRSTRSQERWTSLKKLYDPHLLAHARTSMGTTLLRVLDPEEVVDEAWMRVFESWDDFRYEKKHSLRAWLCLQVNRVILDRCRREQRRPPALLLGSDDGLREDRPSRAPERAGHRRRPPGPPGHPDQGDRRAAGHLPPCPSSDLARGEAARTSRARAQRQAQHAHRPGAKGHGAPARTAGPEPPLISIETTISCQRAAR